MWEQMSIVRREMVENRQQYSKLVDICPNVIIKNELAFFYFLEMIQKAPCEHEIYKWFLFLICV